ncbi:c-type cytochrome [Candidatus Poribacteria bacterium]|nr:c-type cytochrome [Candidatus Poribacteria bacterium]
MSIYLIIIIVLSSLSQISDEIPRGTLPLGLEPEFEIPKGNVITEEKVRLGKRLFFDKRLSKDETISCATCHNPAKGFSNALAVAKGVFGESGNRNVPTVVNRLYGGTEFWDGRAATLESQALGPLFNPLEMGMNEALLLERVKTDAVYGKLFYDAFGDPEPTAERIGKAIACFERTLVTGDSAFDRYEWDGETSALSASAVRGLALFRGKARCSTCHIGTNFTDERFHNIGAGEAGQNDAGRAGVTGDAADFGKFKTPTLRNIAQTAPYMHDGSLERLEDVIAFYDRGGRPNPNLDVEMKPLELSESEREDLRAFLESLTGRVISLNVEELEAALE